ncbi:MAG: hypothetical protein EOM05_05040 [Clostridia bacterium]|nr:hypothetical protein [Clostridia bacterium]
MGTTFIFKTFLEISLVLILVWGFANEDKIIDFEDKFAWLVAAYIRKVKRNKAIKKRQQLIYNTSFNTISNVNTKKIVYHTSDNVA